MHRFDASTLNFGEVVQHISQHIALRATFRLKRVLENEVLGPWPLHCCAFCIIPHTYKYH